MPKTLLLDQTAWDLVLTAGGDIAVADEPYALAQDVAAAVRTWLGDCWYDTTIGLPYAESILGQDPPLQFVRAKVTDAALSVPNVIEVLDVQLSLSGRTLTGYIKFTDAAGVESGVSF